MLHPIPTSPAQPGAPSEPPGARGLGLMTVRSDSKAAGGVGVVWGGLNPPGVFLAGPRRPRGKWGFGE